MKYNDRELVKLGEGKADLEGILHHMKPSRSDWSDWYQSPSFKERYFKLISNLLFYYRVSEKEPIGILVLENAQIAYETNSTISFAFSITFKVSDGCKEEAKHIFSCRCDDDVNRWVMALKMASYEYWRNLYHILKTKLSIKQGQDPVLDYMKKNSKKCEETCQTLKHINSSKFYAHIEESFVVKNSFTNGSAVISSTNDNLIDL